MTAELSEQLARAVGFRNVLVHEYVTVDGTPVVRRLEDLSDLDRFVSAVIDWMPSRT
ncbi:HepT-like ribonuclease domain-containing protein [Actinomycetospora cinnamomea]|uniref:HepT-like ribonuclease domain-containing protein n=1 Tax=Actinomycetospora cinnamomea TaxID=663609 RepID=UPI001A9C79BF|nr:HepT-like ribonuclease domain-containing protein [Actinomycetospora cinnamomea]